MLKHLELSVSEWNSNTYSEMEDLLRKGIPISITNIPLPSPNWKSILTNEDYVSTVDLEEVNVRSLVFFFIIPNSH
jgi:hypothetical protein